MINIVITTSNRKTAEFIRGKILEELSHIKGINYIHSERKISTRNMDIKFYPSDKYKIAGLKPDYFYTDSFDVSEFFIYRGANDITSMDKLLELCRNIEEENMFMPPEVDNINRNIFIAPLSNDIFGIKNVIFNEPATIVYWSDGSKTVVKCQKGDTFDKEKGLAMAISKKALGNRGNYNDILNKWIGELNGLQR